ncbi:DUF4142 domain-containing protein [Parapedobacter soli]|uniref:DUF4142 domain-containing protein n=1 Tax=Parapedobacter soli TaxID=416955 RepID=UPI0021C8C684|nr:DUF4142 domain-containing protein [Parapedobacter soli]
MNAKNNFLAAASLAVLVLGSCARPSGEQVSRSTLYNDETKVDTEGFVFFKTVHEKAQFETQLAQYVQAGAASAQAKDLAAKVIETYEPIAAELEDLAADFFVLLPHPGTAQFAAADHFESDTLGTFDNAAYIAHVQHEQAAIIDQFSRVSRNTSKQLQDYVEEKLPAVKAVFAAAGGQQDHSAHH